jgi:hypothetical protein
MMHANHQKAEFSIAFIHAVASVAGYTFIGSPHIDDDSVDLVLGASRGQGMARRAPRLDIQAKCHAEDDSGNLGEVLAYRLTEKNYDDLRDNLVHVPRILIVLCVPQDLTLWLQETPSETAMRRVAYWLSLRDFPDMTPTTTADPRTTVHLRRSQRFTVDALKSIMTRIGEGGVP